MPKWTKAALNDIERIFYYIAQDNEDAARKVASQIHELSEKLDKYPQMGQQGSVSGTRELVIPKWPYILVYRIQERPEIEILRVLHAKQKWP